MFRVNPRKLTLRYGCALGLVALLAVISHFVLMGALASAEGSNEIIVLSGRQTMLSQRIAALALEVVDGQQDARIPLRGAIGQFREAHVRLVGLSGQSAGGKTAGKIHAIYFGPRAIDAKARTFLEAATRIEKNAVERPDAASHAIQHDSLTISQLARGPLLSGLQDVFTLHRDLSQARIENLMRLQWAILAIVLLTLVFEVYFIFRPMVQGVTDYVGQLLEVADHDFLTQLLNRRAFTARAMSEVRRARRYGHRLSVLMFDIDHFKRVNDTHGHQAGDAVLVAIARLLEVEARHCDVVARVGGEEFAAVLPETGLAEAIDVAERLRIAVASQPVMAGSQQLCVTISVGVAEVSLDGHVNLGSEFAHADEMLYRAKRSGRNAVWPRLVAVASGEAASG